MQKQLPGRSGYYLYIDPKFIAINGSQKLDHLSHIPAHKVVATVAPFQAWRSLQLQIARGPEATILRKSDDFQLQ